MNEEKYIEKSSKGRYVVAKELVSSTVYIFLNWQVAGGISAFFDFPFDTIKVLQQINPVFLLFNLIQNTYKSTIDCIGKTYRKYGLNGFYKVCYILLVNRVFQALQLDVFSKV